MHKLLGVAAAAYLLLVMVLQNPSQIIVTLQYEGKDNQDAMSISQGIPTANITSAEELTHSWGQDLNIKQYYDDRGSVIAETTLQKQFDGTYVPGIAYLRVRIAPDGVLDDACALAGYFALARAQVYPQKHEPAFSNILGTKFQGTTYLSAHRNSSQSSASLYNELLVKYLSSIDALTKQVAKQQNDQDSQLRHAGMERYRQAEEFISKQELQTLATLEQDARRRPDKKLELTDEGCMDEHLVILATSAASARIFTKLYQEHAVDINMVLSHLTTPLLVKDWLPLLHTILGTAKINSATWQIAIQCLFQSGEAPDRYRPLLEQLVIQKGDADALNALFFTVNKDTGQDERIVSYANLALLKKLAALKTLPSVCITCAKYALSIHDYALTESFCSGLLFQRYKGFDNPDSPPSNEDQELSTAREKAMDILFYGLCNERAFKLIYDRAHIVKAQEVTNKDKPLDSWVRFDNYILGRLEIEKAYSLIDSIKGFAEGIR